MQDIDAGRLGSHKLLLFFAAAIERCDEMNNSEVAEEEDREMQRRKTFSKSSLLTPTAHSSSQTPSKLRGTTPR